MRPQTDLDRFTNDELCQMHLDTYRRGLAHFENAERLLAIMSGLAYPGAEYDERKAEMHTAAAAGREAHEMLREIGATLAARRANADA